MDENDRIIIKRISRHRNTGGPEDETVHIFRAGGGSPGKRWLTYLLLAPFLIIMVVLGIFFFTAFLALFAVAAVGFGLRLWWLRHKLRKTMDAEETQMDVEEAEYVVIEDAEIIEESTDRANKNKHRDHHEPP
jgi:Flp pilus assembly protein TadB